MPVAGIVTLIAVAVVVAALAIYLIRVIWLLNDASYNLGTVIAGLGAIAHQTEPLGDRIRGFNQNLESLRVATSQAVAGARAARPRTSNAAGATEQTTTTATMKQEASPRSRPSPARKRGARKKAVKKRKSTGTAQG